MKRASVLMNERSEWCSSQGLTFAPPPTGLARIRQQVAQPADHRVGLHHVADPERGHHAKQGEGAADRAGRRHARNVARSDGRGECRGQRLEMGDVAALFGLVVFAQHAGDRVAEVAHLNKEQPEGQEKPGAQPLSACGGEAVCYTFVAKKRV